MFIKDGDSGKNENLFGKVRECLCLWECESRQETLIVGGRQQKAGGGGMRQEAGGRR